jgi:hypothetical protein
MPRTKAPDHLPAHIRDDPQVVAACRDRNLGRVLRLIQNLSDGQWTNSHLARRIQCSPSRIAEYMTGTRLAQYIPVFERVADGLRIPGARFGLPAREWEAGEPKDGAVVLAREAPPGQAGTVAVELPRSLTYASSVTATLKTVTDLGRADVQRRSVLAAAAYTLPALALASRDWLLSTLEAIEGGRGRRVGADDLAAIREAFAAFQEADVIGGGGDDVRRAVAAYLTDYVMPIVREPQAAGVQEALYEVAAEQTYLAGWLAFDGGRHGLALRYLIQSLRLAQASGNAVLGAHVLAGLSDQATQLGHPAEGRSLAQAGRHGLRGMHAPAAMCDLYVLEARAHAALGLAMEAVHAIDAAERWYDRIRVQDEPEWARFIDEGYVAGEIANSLRDVRDTDASERFAMASIAACRAQGRARRASLSYAAMAGARLHGGDVEGAAEAAGRSLRLAEGVPSIRCTAALQGLSERLSPYAGNAAADRFVGALAAAGR